MSGLSREVEGLASKHEAMLSKRARYKMRLAIYRRKVAAFRTCFLDDDGALTEDARIVLADVSHQAGLGMARKNRATEDVHFDEGQRAIVLRMIDMMTLDHGKLARMARQLRETDDE